MPTCPLLAPPIGDLTICGDGGNNELELRAGPAGGAFTLTGKNNTAVGLNAGAPGAAPLAVPGILGNISIDLNGGADVLTFDGNLAGAGAPSFVPGVLNIFSPIGATNTTIQNVTVGGGLTFLPGPGFSPLTINNSAFGAESLILSGGSQTDIKIDGSAFTSIIGLPSLTIAGAAAQDIIGVSGSSVFAVGGPPPFPANVNIVTGGGGARTTFTGAVTVAGGINIAYGANTPLEDELVFFNGVTVTEGVVIATGPGNTAVNIMNSDIGTSPAVPSPVTIVGNNPGYETVVVTGSSIPWGLEINEPFGDTTGKSISIANSEIGLHALAPTVVHGGFPLGDTLAIGLDNGPNIVNVSASNIGGNLNFTKFGPGGGPNDITFTGNVVAGGFNYLGGTGPNDVTISNSTIPTFLTVILPGPAKNILTIRGTDLPLIVALAAGLNPTDEFRTDLGGPLPPGFEILTILL